MLRAVLIDDEQPSLDLLKRTIINSKAGNIQVVGEFSNGWDALEQIPRLRPDVIFSDIEMMDLNGIRLIEMLQDQENMQVVFVTAYDHYALEAFRVGAVNYLLKPITEESLGITISRLLKRYDSGKLPEESRRTSRIESLGSLQVYGIKEENPISWPTSKTQELFAYLLCQKGKNVDKWQLCDILWPSVTPEKAAHSLYSTMNRMKKTLQDAGVDAITRCIKGRYTMDIQELWWDAEEMAHYLQNNAAVTEENAGSFEKMLHLYHGGLFETEGYIWALAQSEHLNRAYLKGRELLADYYMSRQQYQQAEDQLESLLSREPASEEAVVKLMEIHYHRGNKEKLDRCYKRLEDYLEREFDLEPKGFTKTAYEKFLNML